MLRVNTLKPQVGARTSKKRLGRGAGSGLGQTSGKGDKGQLARSGGTVRPGFEGGQMPLYRRIPKRGFTNPTRASKLELNLSDLEVIAGKGGVVSPAVIIEQKSKKGRFELLAVLGQGTVTRAIKVSAHKFSASAKAAIEAAGGSAEIIPIPKYIREKKKKS